MKRIVSLLVVAAAGLALLFGMPDRHDAADLILAGTTAVAWAFVLVYMLRSHWQVTAAGRAIVRLVVCIAVICTQGLAAILTDYPGREIVRPVLLLAVGIALFDLLWTLVRIQRTEGADYDVP